MAGAPVGNTNAHKGRRWRDAIDRALEKKSRGEQQQALDECAAALIDKCLEGDMTALKELGDRLDGKSVQAVNLGNEDGGRLVLHVLYGGEKPVEG